jgi:hypothetical protein
MPATSQLMNETLMEVEHTPPVHKRVLDIMPGVAGGVARIMVRHKLGACNGWCKVHCWQQ